MGHGHGPLGDVGHVRHVRLPGDRPPWTPTGLIVEYGDVVTLLGSGFVRWSSREGSGAGPKYHLWGRVGGGEVFGCTQDTTTFTAERAGELELCVYIGAWADRFGNLATGSAPYRRVAGSIDVAILHWPPGTDPVVALRAADDPSLDRRLLQAELDRLLHPVEPPAGWTHLLEFGPTDIFRTARVSGEAAIEVLCDDDAGILQKPVTVPLDPSTTIEWTWQVDSLPSSVAENTTWTHDYLSVAAEFDSGRDLTWFWSSSLTPVDATFDCPVRRWAGRETHMPVRSGSDGLGRPQREVRNIWDDHRRFMGPPPAQVVKVWLIAVSHFSHGLGHAVFSDLRVSTAGTTVQVL